MPHAKKLLRPRSCKYAHIMIRIYTNSVDILFWLQEAGLSQTWSEHEIVSDLREYLLCSPGLAVIDVTDHEPDTVQQIRVAVDHSTHTIFFISEFTDDVLCRQFDRADVTFFLSGALNYELSHARVLPYNIHIWEPVAFYQNHPNLLNKLDHGRFRPRLFDVLLGRPKIHRQRIFNNVDHQRNIVTMFRNDLESDLRQRDESEFMWPQDLSSPDQAVCYTREQIRVSDTWISISRVIPHDVYNQTYYSVVAETLYSGDWTLFSEKIAKPLLARRLFVVSSSRYYLHNLRALGFRTFDGIIDESYDIEPDDDARVDQVLEQIRLLGDRDPREIQQLVEPIVEYNFNRAWHNTWRQDLLDQLAMIMLDIAKYPGGTK